MTTQKEGEEQGKLQAGGGSHCRIQKHLEAVLDQSFPVIVTQKLQCGWLGTAFQSLPAPGGFPVVVGTTRATWDPFLWDTGLFSHRRVFHRMDQPHNS